VTSSQRSVRIGPKRWELLMEWAVIGLQSIGGGSSAMLLIKRTFVERHAFITGDEFQEYLTVSLYAPGINIIAIAILIGRRLGGYCGVLISVLGLLLPSAVITCLLTAGYRLVRNSSLVIAAMRGIIPASGGLMLVVALNFAVPLLRPHSEFGAGSVPRAVAGVILALGSSIAIISLHISPIVILIFTAVLGAMLFRPPGKTTPDDEGGTGQRNP
jgi:chromate transporter